MKDTKRNICELQKRQQEYLEHFKWSAVLFVHPRLELMESLVAEQRPVKLNSLMRKLKMSRSFLGRHIDTLTDVGLAEKVESGSYKATGQGRNFYERLFGKLI